MNLSPQTKTRALVAFAVTVVIAWLMRWEAGDLMWGIWASSSTYGYVYALVLLKYNPKELDAGDGSNLGRMAGILVFFTFVFGTAHYAQGIFLSMVYPLTPMEGWDLLLYPLTALTWYWGVIATTFYSRWPELKAATLPSDDPHRLLMPFKSIVPIQIFVFAFMFLAAAGLIRFAVYPVLVFYFFPFHFYRDKLKHWYDRLDERIHTPPPSEFDEIDEADE